MEIELDPPQPTAVGQAVVQLVAARERPVDPWWAAGIEEALGHGCGAPDDASVAGRPGSG
jgi:hypothetical protein